MKNGTQHGSSGNPVSHLSTVLKSLIALYTRHLSIQCYVHVHIPATDMFWFCQLFLWSTENCPLFVNKRCALLSRALSSSSTLGLTSPPPSTLPPPTHLKILYKTLPSKSIPRSRAACNRFHHIPLRPHLHYMYIICTWLWILHKVGYLSSAFRGGGGGVGGKACSPDQT